jgi:hypothetical protein
MGPTTTKAAAPSEMGRVMVTLLRAVEAWSDLANDGSERRVELLGLLVQLTSRRFHGFREVPSEDDLVLEVKGDAVSLRIRSPGRVPMSSEVVERQLSKFGFVTERTAGTENRELHVAWTRETPIATVLEFPRAAALASRSKSGRTRRR